MNTLRYFLFYIIIILSPNIVSASDLKEEFGLKHIEKDDWDKLKENLKFH